MLSIFELLIALTVLVSLRTVGLKIFQSTQISFVDGRTSLVKAKRNESIADFVCNDFVDKALLPTDAPWLYVNSQLPAYLQPAEKLAVAKKIGNAVRFQLVAPKSRSSWDAN